MNLPDGDAAVPFTAALMHEAARRLAAQCPQQLHALVQSGKPATATISHRLYDALSRLYQYAPDPPMAEYIRNHARQVIAMATGERQGGDCDDLSVIGAAALIVAGVPYAFITVARSTGPYEHIFVASGSATTGYTPIDPQEASGPGQWPDDVRRAEVWPAP